jgi:hypothetical protein
MTNDTKFALAGAAAQRAESSSHAGATAGVRERLPSPCADVIPAATEYRPAHPSQPFPVHLNSDWRVIDDPLQWILQSRKGNPRQKNPGWSARYFLRTRGGLLTYVREHCGEVEESALAGLRSLPEWHP